MTPRQRIFASWTADLLVYIVVLNLYVEYSAAKVIDSFTISILTAVLLKVLLDLVVAGKHRVLNWSRRRVGRMYTFLGLLGVWTILFLSKFLILEAVDFVLGDRVELGSFIDVMLLVIVMMLARELLQRTYETLGRE